MQDHAIPIDLVIAWHGRLMVIAWVFLLPAGIIVARFFKITPRQRWPDEIDNRFWWRSHLWLQCLGGIALLVALVLILIAPEDVHRQNWLHRYLGWLLVSLCFVQFMSGLLRGTTGGPDRPAPDGTFSGDHFDMTLRRRVFEAVHRSNGYLLLVLSVASVVTGIATALAPVWKLPLIVMWWLLLIAAFVYLQRRGMHLDSYQAIWGQGASPETRHQIISRAQAARVSKPASDHPSTSGKSNA